MAEYGRVGRQERGRFGRKGLKVASWGQLPAGLRKQVAAGGSLQRVMITAGSSETFLFSADPGKLSAG